ncbi:hypothetical protein AMATHDRAFT_54233 [Amanita thiersii Skay4041]|uniref:Plasma membrane fusion protein PRM1 n=1 Tax=Amanita thiersii Skay4041 TaxID=703135 RepID=A0A2A9NYZ2_9AGAR|nr:hypothetical protein AMATHDRAFT_54233 [Amanita thiersii Skay4041]
MTSSPTPYLQLPDLLSLTWLAYPVLSLLFIAFRLQISLASTQDSLANAKSNLIASCAAAERAATSAASMPRYMAIATNAQFADAVNGTINAARAALVLALTAMEGIVNFVVDIYRSTFLCLLELVVRGALSVLIAAVQELNTLIQNVGNGLRTSIQSDIAKANDIIKSAIDAINKVNPFSDITAPQITVPSLDGLQNISLPSSFQDALTKLNDTIPSVDVLKDKLESVIDKPFELLKADINNTFTGISFNASTLPVPEQNTITFCNDLDMSIVDDLGNDIIKTAKIGLIIIILLALLLIALNCALTWFRWRSLKAHLEYTRQAWMADPAIYHTKPAASSIPQMTLSDHNLMMLQANASHPLIARFTNRLSAKLRLGPTAHINLQWFFNYIFHPPALACFLIGFFGLLCVEMQLLAMGPLVAKFSDRATATTADFSNTIATAMNASMYNQSSVYANDVNGRVDVIQGTINNGVFGWVNTTTTTLNTTLNEFYNDVQNAISVVFDGTILENPAHEFIRCFIGTKVEAIENALTFLHDNLKVDMPRMNQSALVLSPETVNEAARPIAAAAVGGGDDGDDRGLVGKIVDAYADSLRKERIMFAIFMGLWGVIVLMAICILLWRTYGRRWRESRGRRRWEKEQRSGIDGVVVPFRTKGGSMDEKQQQFDSGFGAPGGGAGGLLQLKAFTPLPSPYGGSRAVSPAGSGPSPSVQHRYSRSDETLVFNRAAGVGDGRDSFFGGRGERTVPHGPSVKERLMAVGRKASARGPGWLQKMASRLDKDNKPAIESEPAVEDSRPKLTLTTDTGSSPAALASNNEKGEDGLYSHWSASTEESRPTKKIIANLTYLPLPTPPLPPPSRPIGGRSSPAASSRSLSPSGLSPQRRKNDREEAVTVAPIPLYQGFTAPQTQLSPVRGRLSPPPPVVDWDNEYKKSEAWPVTPPLNTGARKVKRKPSPPTLAVSFNSTAANNASTTSTGGRKQSTDSDGGESGGSVTPVTRLLTTTPSRRSSSAMNPFMTPFDDEYQMQQKTRKTTSSVTDPFSPSGVAF